jgi:peptidoglycan/LPS O-acetylase OafA/YrhL
MSKHDSAGYLPYVDGLRAVAILSVLTFHLSPSWLPGGFSGVDIFFVISGFVVSASVGALAGFKPTSFLLFFYSRRLLRIAPALIACLLITHVATTVLVPDSWLSDANQRTGLYALFGLSNIILATNTDTYFSPRLEFNPFTHTWSLGVEEQFYLVFPLIFVLWVLGEKRRRQTVALFGALLICSLAYSAWMGRIDSKFAFYMFPSRFWELAAGVLPYQIMTVSGYWTRARKSPAPQWFRLGAAASIALLLWGFFFAKSEAFPFPGAVPTTVGSVGLLLFLYGQGRKNLFVRALTAQPILFIGRISYSLYLWHWPVFVLFRWTVGLDAAIFQVIALAFAFALAIASYYFVEPLRYSRALQRAPRYASVAGSLAVIAGGAALANQLHEARAFLSISSVTRHADDWYPDGSDVSPAYPGCILQTAGRIIGTSFILTRQRVGCERAVIGPRIFVVGDSHAFAYNAMLRSYALETGLQISMYSNGGCSFLSLQPSSEDCSSNTDASTTDLLERLQAGDILFLPSLRLPRFADQWGRFPEQQAKDAVFSDWAKAERAQAVAVARVTLQRFEERGVRIILEGPPPLFKAPTFRCVEFYNKTNDICSKGLEINRAELEEFRKPVLDAFLRLSKEVPGVHVWDPFPLLCPPGDLCSAIVAGHPLFFDQDHLSGYANRMLFPAFRDFVLSLN